MVWADTSYRFKKKIIIDYTKVSADETSFPVLISLTDGDLRSVHNGGHVQNDSGYDICFYDSTETTKYNHEIELYTSSIGKLIYWVNVTSLSSTINTILYIYYGNPNITTNPSTIDAWNTNYKGVWHMNDTSGVNDSTTNANDGASAGTPTYSQTGLIGDCILFDGDGEYFDCGDNGTLDFGTGAFTVEVWVKGSTNESKIELCKKDWDTHGAGYMMWTSTTLTYFHLSNGAASKYASITDNLSDGNWTHIVGIRNGDAIYIYVDKVKGTDGSGVAAYNVNATFTFRIGSDASPKLTWDGSIDEVRVINGAKASTYITTSYNTQYSPSTFFTIGREIGNDSLYGRISLSPTSEIWDKTVSLSEILYKSITDITNNTIKEGC